ncbi:MAG: hypothetical protein HY619_03245 [Thaumarchaeota archaeon]|nr:hypothetical protein [Nitrososphaerota archaeon]
MPKGLTREKVDKWWAATHFYTADDHKLIYELTCDFLTQKKIDVILLYIMDLALSYRCLLEELRAKTKTNPSRIKLGDADKLHDAIQVIRRSPLSPLLHPVAEAAAQTLAMQPNEKTIIKKLADDHIASNNPSRFTVALCFLDAFPSTKPTKYTESFFICLLSDRFKRTTDNPNFPKVSKIIGVCFGDEDITVKVLDQRRRDFTAKFPNWPKVAAVIYKDGAKKILKGLPKA